MIILVWIINALIVMAVAYLVPGIRVASFWTALIVALVLGLLNAFVRPLLLLFTLPINILTLGLFTFVINGLMLLLVSAIVKGFTVDGLVAGIIGALVLSLFHVIVNLVIHK